jgi:hypothetical protein
VGKSTSGLRRPRDHFTPSHLCNDNTYKGRWLRKLHKDNVKVDIVVLQTLEEVDQLNDAEIKWIAIAREALGARLTNVTAGGEGATGMVMTAEVCAMHKSLRKKEWADDKTRAMRKAALTLAWKDEELRERTRLKTKEIWTRPGHREKVTSKQKQTKATPEFKARASAAQIKAKCNGEYHRQASAAAKRMWERPEYAAKHTKAHAERRARDAIKGRVIRAWRNELGLGFNATFRILGVDGKTLWRYEKIARES